MTILNDIGTRINNAYEELVTHLDDDFKKLSMDAVPSYMELAKNIHDDIVVKLAEIRKKYEDYPSYQHAAWIIQEEYLEVRDELLKKDADWDYTKIYKELIDLITACYRTIIDRDLLSKVAESANNEVK